jgi:hypothetical protein
MTNTEMDSLSAIYSFRAKVRMDRRGFWFPLVVFGALTLLSTPLYWKYNLGSSGCGEQVTTSCISGTSNSPLSGGLDPEYALNGLSPWITLYWVAAFALGYSSSVCYFILRVRKFGVRGRIRLPVAIGSAVLFAVLITNLLVISLSNQISLASDFWIRGSASLVLLAIFFLAMGIVERSVSFTIYAFVFLGITLLSSLYDVSNLFARLHIDGLFAQGGQELPNLLLPAGYLLVGGLIYWILQRRQPSLAETAKIIDGR